MKKNLARYAVAIAVVFSLSPAVYAQSDSIKRLDNSATAKEIFYEIFPTKRRSLSDRPLPEAVALSVPFANDSAAILPGAESLIAEIGKAISVGQKRGMGVILEGHASRTGDARYNLELSQNRADAVKRFIVSRFDLDPALVITLGKGYSEPLDGLAPGHDANRRVQIKYLRK